MLKRFFLVTLGVALVVSMGYAQQQSTKASIVRVSLKGGNAGEQMYTTYCASCHGVDGRGQGPAAAALKTKPADLSALSKNNNGKYPASHVASVLEFGSKISAHGSKEMPVWGQTLANLNPGAASTQEATTYRVNQLVSYLETLQVK
jgi:mono/diheme cytochrome c family protein